jgi:UDP-N-acetylmuramyl pentapeptide synthase
MVEVVLEDPWTDWGRSGGVLVAGADRLTWEIETMAPGLLQEALRGIRSAVANGASLGGAVTALGDAREPHILDVHSVGQGVLVIDDTGTRGVNDAATSLKIVTGLAARQRRVVVAAGALDFGGDSDYDDLGAFGALMVRLNVNQVFAVGPDARALFLSVGREGSWDGESQHCVSVDDAYDDIRAFIRPEDVVLVMGTTGQSLLPLARRLVEDLS